LARTLPEIENLVVRATNWVGDAVMSLPALRALRDRYPQAHIAVLALPWVADLYGREPFCDEVIPYTPQRGARDWTGKWNLASQLRSRRFDAAILLQNAFEAALITWLARIPIRIGYNRDGRGALLTHAIPVPEKGVLPPHQSYYYLELLRRAGVTSAAPPSEMIIRLDGAAAAREAGRSLLAARGVDPTATIGVSPGAAYGNAKRWLPERFAETAARLGGPVMLFGSAGERALCDIVAGHLRAVGVMVHNAAGETSLREFIEMAAACRIMLTNDSGAMHIASALGIPTVTVFGATDHIATGPTGPLARIVREPVECSPCLLRECPIDHRCMKAVTADRVVQTAQELLS
jgi:heptosyltransferase-2